MICKLLLVNPADAISVGTAGERSFSVAWKLKTWLYSTMTKERFSNLTVLNSYKNRADKFASLTWQLNLLFVTTKLVLVKNFGIMIKLLESTRPPPPSTLQKRWSWVSPLWKLLCWSCALIPNSLKIDTTNNKNYVQKFVCFTYGYCSWLCQQFEIVLYKDIWR